MKRIFIAVFIIIIIGLTWWFFSGKKQGKKEQKQQALSIQKHTTEFNQAVNNSVNDYLSVKDAFINGDSVSIKLKTQTFITSMDALKLSELTKDDSSILISAQQFASDVKVNAEAILQEKDIEEMRQDFRMVSENLYPFLRTISYEGPKIYWQNCANAFGENNGANWISNTPKIVNPYSGKNASQQQDSLANCGENKDSLQ